MRSHGTVSASRRQDRGRHKPDTGQDLLDGDGIADMDDRAQIAPACAELFPAHKRDAEESVFFQKKMQVFMML